MKNLLMVALALAFVGCQTSQPQGEPNNPAPKQANDKPDNKRLAARQTTRSLRVRVKVAASDDSAADRKLADVVGPNVQKAMCDAGFDVVCSGDAEIEVLGEAKCLSGVARGDRTVCRGSLDLTIRRMDVRNPVTGKEIRRLVNARRFDAKGGEAWTQEESIMSLGDNLASAACKWLRESCVPLRDNLAICTIAVNAMDVDSPIEENYPSDFTRTVLGVQGVYDCRTTPLNPDRTMFSACILYDVRQMPDGVLCRLQSIRALNLE